jgi:hypothetical protein
MPQTAQIELEYLMTVYADLAVAHVIDAGSRIVKLTKDGQRVLISKPRSLHPAPTGCNPFHPASRASSAEVRFRVP